MADNPDEEPGDMEETERQAAQTDHIVNVTVDLMKVAERVITDFDKGDAEFEQSDPPSIMEICAVTQMIMSGSMAGVYRQPEKKGKSTVEELFDMVAPIIESKVSLAVLKATSTKVPAIQSLPAVPTPMPYVPPPSPFDDAVMQMYEDLEKCGCFEKNNMKYCADCEKRNAAADVIHEYMQKKEKQKKEPPAP